jgi:hypothetical protein
MSEKIRVLCGSWIKSGSPTSPEPKMAYYVIHTLDLEYAPWYCDSLEHALNVFIRDLSKRKQNFKRILEIHGGQMMVHQRAPPCTRRKIHKSTVKHETFMDHMPPQNTHISRDF